MILGSIVEISVSVATEIPDSFILVWLANQRSGCTFVKEPNFSHALMTS